MLIDPSPACAIFNHNNPALNINTAPRCTLNDLEPDPVIKIEPLSPDLSSLQISDPSPSSTSPNPPYIADYHPDKYPLFYISPLSNTPCLPHHLLKFNYLYILLLICKNFIKTLY